MPPGTNDSARTIENAFSIELHDMKVKRSQVPPSGVEPVERENENEYNVLHC